MVGGSGVQGRYGEVGSSVEGMARLRRIASSGWAGGEWTRAGWVDVLFSARMDASDLFSLLQNSDHTEF